MSKTRNRFQLSDLRDARRQMRRIAPYALRYWPRLAVYFVSVLLYSMADAGRLLLIRPLIEVLGSPNAGENPSAATGGVENFFAEHNVYVLAGLLFLAGLVMGLGTFGKQYMMHWVQFRASVDVQRDVMRSLMRQPAAFFNTTRKGELMSRVSYDLAGVRSTFHIIFNDLVHHPIRIAVLIAGLIYTSPKLAVGMLILPVIMLPVTVFGGKIKRLSKSSYESHAELSNFFHQFFEGVRVVKAFGMEDSQQRVLQRNAMDFFRRTMKVGKYKSISRTLMEVVLAASLSLSILGGVWLVAAGVTDFATALQFTAFLMMLYAPVRQLGHTLNNMSDSMAANERIFELMDTQPSLSDVAAAVEAPRFSRDIVFENVSFEYLPGRPVLQDITFRAAKGSVTALVGATGAGKSTLIDLIPRFYLPTKGRILVDGVDLARVKQADWLAQIAVVSQETFLFNTTVRENLLAAAPTANEAELIEALKAANIFDEVWALPRRLDTVLGDRGLNLSGGQRQRLAIARAFVKRAPILLLDEATSALDSETERKVQGALDRLIQGATVFAIAHRLSTIIHADRIVVLEQGRILEVGRHDELLARNGRYAMLYRTQIEQPAREPDEVVDRSVSIGKEAS